MDALLKYHKYVGLKGLITVGRELQQQRIRDLLSWVDNSRRKQHLNDLLSGIGTYVHYLLTKITCYYYYYIWPTFIIIIIIINIAYVLPDIMSVFLKFNTMNLLLKILAFGREIHQSPLNFPHKGPVAWSLMFLDIGLQVIWDYRQVSNIRRTKSQHLKDSRTVLRLSLPNPLKPDVKSRMKM